MSIAELEAGLEAGLAMIARESLIRPAPPPHIRAAYERAADGASAPGDNALLITWLEAKA